ncbi:MAG: DUF1127 domain-containing protein [Thalassobaculum sp.]|uniref:DUF1127 domain-containing protein n=1 Tax=Thalassobaculum sp. TaxID=2022740 RepID=UPI0032EE7FC2
MTVCYELPARRIDGTASRLVKGLDSAVRRSAGAISRWNRRRTTIRALQALSDHHLLDIGLERSRIAATVDELLDNEPA